MRAAAPSVAPASARACALPQAREEAPGAPPRRAQQAENVQAFLGPPKRRTRNSDDRRRRRCGARGAVGYTGVTAAKYALSVVIGVVVGCIAAALEWATTELLASRASILAAAADEPPHATFALLCTCSLALALLAGALVQFVAPAAAGGGASPHCPRGAFCRRRPSATCIAPPRSGPGVVPVMIYLNGTYLPQLLSSRTLIVKVVGCALSCASGIAVGPEGPLVHIGACAASVLTSPAFMRWGGGTARGAPPSSSSSSAAAAAADASGTSPIAVPPPPQAAPRRRRSRPHAGREAARGLEQQLSADSAPYKIPYICTNTAPGSPSPLPGPMPTAPAAGPYCFARSGACAHAVPQVSRALAVARRGHAAVLAPAGTVFPPAGRC